MTNEELWRNLEEEVRDLPLQGFQLRRIHIAVERALYLGFQKPENRRVFLLRVPGEVLPRLDALPSLRGVEVFALPRQADGSASVGLSLKEPRYQDIFTALVDDLGTHIAGQPDDAMAIHAFLNRLEKWRRFLESHAEGLSEEAQRGLFGELCCLREHILPCLGTTGVLGWTGACGTPQDFQFPACAVEVKTTITRQLQTLCISNEQQLDDASIDTLFLYHLSLEPLRGSGETLPQLVSTVREVLANDAVAGEYFEDQLLETGYLDAQIWRYEMPGYSLREENVFRVGEGFPRIIESDLASGVGEVSYSISLDLCRPFVVDVADLDNVLRSESNRP